MHCNLWLSYHRELIIYFLCYFIPGNCMFTDLYHMIPWPKYSHVYGIIIQRQIVCKSGDDQVSTSANIFTCFVSSGGTTVYLKKYAHGFVVLCFVVVMQSFIMNSHEVFIHIHQGCFAGTGAIVRLPQCQWSKPDGYGKISQCITTTKHSKAKTVCIFLGIYCRYCYVFVYFRVLQGYQQTYHYRR